VISWLVVMRQSVGTLYQEKDSKVGISHHIEAPSTPSSSHEMEKMIGIVFQPQYKYVYSESGLQSFREKTGH